MVSCQFLSCDDSRAAKIFLAVRPLVLCLCALGLTKTCSFWANFGDNAGIGVAQIHLGECTCCLGPKASVLTQNAGDIQPGIVMWNEFPSSGFRPSELLITRIAALRLLRQSNTAQERSACHGPAAKFGNKIPWRSP